MSESCVWPMSGDRSSMVCSMMSGNNLEAHVHLLKVQREQ